MFELLDLIKEPNDIKNIETVQYAELAKEIRRFLVQHISRTGGHLASNLGVVELTIAMHLCSIFPEDKIVWDVGHQCYTHKLLTGRKEEFDHLRQFGGMSGFPKRNESDCDCIDTGHSSTSISAAIGLAKARDIKGEKHKVYAVIGDGALSGGMAYEALNNAARLKSNLIIILNDNQMSISKNVGGMSRYLSRIRTNTNYTGLKEDIEKALSKMPHIGNRLTGKIRGSRSDKRLFIPGMLFEDMGLTYIGPIDGHDIKQMKEALENAAKPNKAVIVHVCTKKGKGYLPAQNNPSVFHGVGPFHVKDGSMRGADKKATTYTDIFSDSIIEEAKEQGNITAISAAMPLGTGLTEFSKQYPERFFDVGIAEEHAVTFASGMAAGGLHPVVAIYSTFLQRAYDQILHDVCLDSFPVTFAIDRAGLVGSDGETHQGIFDISFLRHMPNMTVMAPKNTWELKEMLHFALQTPSPTAIRYPRGAAYSGLTQFTAPIEMGKSEWVYREKEIALLAVGSMVETAVKVKECLEALGKKVSLINVRFVKPMDEETLEEVTKEHYLIVPMEEGVYDGGFCEAVAAWCQQYHKEVQVLPIALPNQFIEHGSVAQLKEKYRIDAAGIEQKIIEAIKES